MQNMVQLSAGSLGMGAVRLAGQLRRGRVYRREDLARLFTAVGRRLLELAADFLHDRKDFNQLLALVV